MTASVFTDDDPCVRCGFPMKVCQWNCTKSQAQRDRERAARIARAEQEARDLPLFRAGVQQMMRESLEGAVPFNPIHSGRLLLF